MFIIIIIIIVVVVVVVVVVVICLACIWLACSQAQNWGMGVVRSVLASHLWSSHMGPKLVIFFFVGLKPVLSVLCPIVW